MKKRNDKPFQGLISYLIGSMEYAENNGLDWRLEYRDVLEPLGLACIIPNHEEAELVKDPAQFNSLKETNLEEYKYIMRKLIDMDLNFVDQSDFLICRWDGERISGTVGEAQAAYLQNKDVYLVTTQPTSSIPGWFLACTTEIFDSLGCLVLYLKDKWSL